MNEHYILEGREAVPCDMMTWATWLQNSRDDRIVGRDTIGASRVSTVFLGLNHRFDRGGPPLIFETLVFGGPLDQEMDRYSTYAEAEAGHAAMCKKVRELQQ